jgi:hypothetical protein
MKRRPAKTTEIPRPFYCQHLGCSALACVRVPGRAFCSDHIPHDWPDPLPQFCVRQPPPVHGEGPSD